VPVFESIFGEGRICMTLNCCSIKTKEVTITTKNSASVDSLHSAPLNLWYHEDWKDLDLDPILFWGNEVSWGWRGPLSILAFFSNLLTGGSLAGSSSVVIIRGSACVIGKGTLI
jgi:hypothetical protein